MTVFYEFFEKLVRFFNPFMTFLTIFMTFLTIFMTFLTIVSLFWKNKKIFWPFLRLFWKTFSIFWHFYDLFDNFYDLFDHFYESFDHLFDFFERPQNQAPIKNPNLYLLNMETLTWERGGLINPSYIDENNTSGDRFFNLNGKVLINKMESPRIFEIDLKKILIDLG